MRYVDITIVAKDATPFEFNDFNDEGSGTLAAAQLEAKTDIKAPISGTEIVIPYESICYATIDYLGESETGYDNNCPPDEP